MWHRSAWQEMNNLQSSQGLKELHSFPMEKETRSSRSLEEKQERFYQIVSLSKSSGNTVRRVKHKRTASQWAIQIWCSRENCTEEPAHLRTLIFCLSPVFMENTQGFTSVKTETDVCKTCFSFIIQVFRCCCSLVFISSHELENTANYQNDDISLTTQPLIMQLNSGAVIDFDVYFWNSLNRFFLVNIRR